MPVLIPVGHSNFPASGMNSVGFGWALDDPSDCPSDGYGDGWGDGWCGDAPGDGFGGGFGDGFGDGHGGNPWADGGVRNFDENALCLF